MANPEHLAKLNEGAEAWNEWRKKQPEIAPDLSAADIAGADLTDADLRGANLEYANLRGAKLGPGTVIVGANLSGADLYRADLSGASWPEQFANVDLSNASLREADLKNVDLSKLKRGLQTEQLAGSDLTGAKLPDQLKKLYDSLDNVKGISESARKIFLAVLAACLYCWLTIATTTDVNLITNRASSPLPIIQTAIPIVGFYVVAPLLVLCVYFYFHFYLQKLWEELGSLPAVFPDGRPLHTKVDPWLLNDLVRAHLPRLNVGRPFLSYLQLWISVLLAWWVVPITMFLFWGRYLRRQERIGTTFHVALLVISLVAAVSLYHLAVATLRGDERKASALAGRRGQLIAAVAVVPMVMILVGLFLRVFILRQGIPALLVISLVGAISLYRLALTTRLVAEREPFAWNWKGARTGHRRYLTAVFAVAAAANVLLLLPSLLDYHSVSVLYGSGPYPYVALSVIWLVAVVCLYLLAVATLRGTERKPFAWNRTFPSRRGYQTAAFPVAAGVLFGLVSWEARWGAEDSFVPVTMYFLGYPPYANLRNAEVSQKKATWSRKNDNDPDSVIGAQLVGVKLRHAWAIRAFFADADLSNADLRDAHLSAAVLSGVNLSGADLSGADLSGANLGAAYMKKTDLRGAHLSRADLEHAYLSGANLSGADLRDAHLDGADLSGAHLSGADLSGADLSAAVLSGADLRDAHLSGADLSGANLSDAYMKGADLRDAHLSGAELKHAYLWGAALSNADLRSANLSVAQLEDAGLSNANLNGASLSDASLSGASLSHTDLRGTKNLKTWQVKQASYFDKAFYDCTMIGQLGFPLDNNVRVFEDLHKFDTEHPPKQDEKQPEPCPPPKQ